MPPTLQRRSCSGKAAGYSVASARSLTLTAASVGASLDSHEPPDRTELHYCFEACCLDWGGDVRPRGEAPAGGELTLFEAVDRAPDLLLLCRSSQGRGRPGVT